MFSFSAVQAQNQPLFQNQAAPTDTAKTDSVKKPAKVVKPLTMRYNLLNIRQGQTEGYDGTKYYLDSIKIDLRRLTLWDETDTLPGFCQTLGMIGKPNRQYLYGLSASYFEANRYVNPVTGQPNVYILNPETQLPALDTRTPYFEIDYDQSDGEIQLFKGTVSQNITPFLNATVLYRSKNGVGLFNGQTTRQINMGGRITYRSMKERLFLTAFYGLSEHQDFMNGGARQTGDETADEMFSTRAMTPWFSGTQNANLTQRVSTFGGQAVFRLLNDSTNRLELLADARVYNHFTWYDDRKFRFTTGNRLAANAAYPLFPYAWYYSSADSVSESYVAQTIQGWAGARYRLKIGRFRWHNQAEIQFSQLNLKGALIVSGQFKQELRGLSTLSLPGQNRIFYVQADVRQANNSLLPSEFSWALRGKLAFPIVRYALVDSGGMDSAAKRLKKLMRKPVVFRGSYTPFELTAHFQTATRNPTLFSAYWQGATFLGNPYLSNEKPVHFRAAARYTGKTKMRKALPFLQNYYQVSAFFSQVFSPVYYDTAGVVRQAGGTDAYRWLGVSVDFRLRFSRFYLENATTFQTGSATTQALNRYANNLPTLFGKASFYLQTRVPKTPLRLHTGLDCVYQTAYAGFAFDPSTQNFYPQSDYRISPYARLDVHVGVELKNAYIYFKFLNVLDGVGFVGYSTTPFYPMTARSFCFGFNWTFFD